MLREYLKLFADFTKTSLSVSRICRYLQRYWIPGNLGKNVEQIEVREIYPVSNHFYEIMAKIGIQFEGDKIFFSINLTIQLFVIFYIYG
jgi:hypothetical protein